MAKILLLVVLLLVVYMFFKGWRRDGTPVDRRPAPKTQLPEDMVRCEVCGVNLPRSEAFTSRGRLFCSDDHLKIGNSRHS